MAAPSTTNHLVASRRVYEILGVNEVTSQTHAHTHARTLARKHIRTHTHAHAHTPKNKACQKCMIHFPMFTWRLFGRTHIHMHAVSGKKKKASQKCMILSPKVIWGLFGQEALFPVPAALVLQRRWTWAGAACVSGIVCSSENPLQSRRRAAWDRLQMMCPHVKREGGRDDL